MVTKTQWLKSDELGDNLIQFWNNENGMVFCNIWAAKCLRLGFCHDIEAKYSNKKVEVFLKKNWKYFKCQNLFLFSLSISLEYRQKRICLDNLKGKTNAINCNVFNVYVKLFRKCNAMLRNKKASFFCASDFLVEKEKCRSLFFAFYYSAVH